MVRDPIAHGECSVSKEVAGQYQPARIEINEHDGDRFCPYSFNYIWLESFNDKDSFFKDYSKEVNSGAVADFTESQAPTTLRSENREKICKACQSDPEYLAVHDSCIYKESFKKEHLFRITLNDETSQAPICPICKDNAHIKKDGLKTILIHDVICSGHPTEIEITHHAYKCVGNGHTKRINAPIQGFQTIDRGKLSPRLVASIENLNTDNFPHPKYIAEGYGISRRTVQEYRRKEAKAVADEVQDRYMNDVYIERFVNDDGYRQRSTFKKLIWNNRTFCLSVKLEITTRGEFFLRLLDMYPAEDIEKISRLSEGNLDIHNLPQLSNTALSCLLYDYCTYRRESTTNLDYLALEVAAAYVIEIRWMRRSPSRDLEDSIQELLASAQSDFSDCALLRDISEQIIALGNLEGSESLINACITNLLDYIDGYEESVPIVCKNEPYQIPLSELRVALEAHISYIQDKLGYLGSSVSFDDVKSGLLFVNRAVVPYVFRPEDDMTASSAISKSGEIDMSCVSDRGIPLQCVYHLLQLLPSAPCPPIFTDNEFLRSQYHSPKCFFPHSSEDDSLQWLPDFDCPIIRVIR